MGKIHIYAIQIDVFVDFLFVVLRMCIHEHEICLLLAMILSDEVDL